MMATVHAYTSDQPLADNTRVRQRRSRSAVENIIPNETPSPRLVEAMFPHLKGKVKGVAFNVPVPDGSCIDLTTEHDKMPSVDNVNEVMKTWSQGDLSHIVGYTEDPIVSSDVIIVVLKVCDDGVVEGSIRPSREWISLLECSC